jgi:hypothetical protein
MLSFSEKGADPNMGHDLKGFRSKIPVWFASREGHLGVVRAIVKAGADVHLETGAGRRRH